MSYPNNPPIRPDMLHLETLGHTGTLNDRASNSSTYIGYRYIPPGYPSNENPVPILVRCIFPPSSSCRHAVIYTLPSVPTPALGDALFTLFDLTPQTLGDGNWIMKLAAYQIGTGLLEGESPSDMIARLGNGRCGVFELEVVRWNEMKCTRCWCVMSDLQAGELHIIAQCL